MNLSYREYLVKLTLLWLAQLVITQCTWCMSVTTRIVGGVVTRSETLNNSTSSTLQANGAIEWQQLVVSIQTLDGQHFCGGVILDERTILTAAHCLLSYKPSTVKVRYNTFTYNAGGNISEISSFVYHPKFENESNANDLALMETSTRLTIDPTRLVLLPNPGQRVPESDQLVTVSGWGYQTENATELSTELRSVQVKVVSRRKCSRVYPGMITAGMFCAGGQEGADACQGDSGGPVVVHSGGEDNSAPTLVGLVSWGYACARQGFPGVYTTVSEYVQWIMENGVTLRY